jgi:peptide/nickel transport system substrate-binding protein
VKKKLKLSISNWLAVALAAFMVLGSSALGSTSAAAAPSGSLSVLEPSSTTGAWNGLDPPTDTTSGENYDFMNSIYGELFEQGANGAVIPDLATGYKVVDNGLEVDITLRQGLTFTDGTPFNAAAVAFNLNRDFTKSLACLCDENFSAVTSTTATGPYEVALHLSHPDTAIIDAFFAEAPDWIVSPSALAKMGESAFALSPVGAGPFEVVSDTPNTTLSLKANPNYWQKGLPKASTLTFTSVSSDTSGYEALVAGQAQAYLGLTTPAVLDEAKKSFDVTTAPATETLSVNLNPNIAPFNNIVAREAVYYATDPEAINQHIVAGTGTISESPTGPGDLFWTPKVPGYRTYDPAKAKALVKQLGGLSFTLSTISSPIYVPIVEAEQSEWAQVGIKAKISLDSISQIVRLTGQGAIQALATQIGSYNPALLPGLSFSFASTGPFSLVKDKALDKLIDAANAEPDQAVEGKMYQNIFFYLNQKAYAPFLFTSNKFDVATNSVTGIDGSLPEIDWQNVAS